MRRMFGMRICLLLGLSVVFGGHRGIAGTGLVGKGQGVQETQQAQRSLAAGAATGYLQDVADGIGALQRWYTPATGLYRTTGWWNSANALTTLADYERVSKSAEYASVFANSFTAAQKTSPGFLNNFYDDEGWWALAWIDAYDVTRNEQYLSMAKSIFADMAGGWDDKCGGGIWWSKDRKYKNAIANELFLSVAAHLASRSAGATRSEYLSWGNREWGWFHASGMINSKGLVNDGLDIRAGKAAGCINNGRTTWSYNQGVILGGLAELAAVNRDASLPLMAQKIATAAITTLVDGNGILHDSCEPKCGADGTQFKGIFVRNLVVLDKAYPQEAYKAFMYANADAIWKSARGPEFELGQVWSGPFAGGDASSQSSALDALMGAASM
jgi:predicted alpha-1,6-mannanase (GH76 family)